MYNESHSPQNITSLQNIASLQPDAFDAVIVASGDFPTHPIPLALISGARMLVACDSAGEQLLQRSIVPTAIVGDCDSMSAAFRQKYKDIIYKVDEQDYNDLTKATRFCIARGCHKIAYVGCTGKREDHTLGNIALLHFFRHELHVSPMMFTDYGTFIPAHGATTFGSFARQQVSIFNLSCTHLEGEGLRWQPYAFKQMWQGTLNEATGDTITLRGDADYLVFLTYEHKD